MSIRARLAKLERLVRPGGLEQQWITFLDHVNRRLEQGWSEDELRQMARAAAARGRHPGDTLAQCLAQVSREQAEPERAERE